MSKLMMIDRRALLAGLGAAAVLPDVAFAKAPAYPAVHALIDRYLAAKKLPGAVVAIKRAGAPVSFISAGTLAFDAKAKAAPNSIYRVYSMTKPFIGVATMRLIQDGKLSLDQKLSDILPDFADIKVLTAAGEARPAASPILIRHLLTHTSGLSYHINGDTPLAKLYRENGITPGSRNTSPDLPGHMAPAHDLEEFGARVAKLPLDFDPGAKWQYSIAIDLLGLVIQRASGMPLFDYLRATIFEPLKLRDTDFVVAPSKLARLTSVYTLTPEGVAHEKAGEPFTPTSLRDSDDRKSSPFARDRDLPSGGGGLVSTPADYARFCQMLLNGGALDGAEVLKPETMAVARSNLMPAGVFQGFGPQPWRNGFGAAMQVILPGGAAKGAEPPGSFGWSGAAGTSMWVDPVNQLFAILMVQFMPSGAYPIGLEVRRAIYSDLEAIGVARGA